MTLWFSSVGGKRWNRLTFSAFVLMWVLFPCCCLWFEVLSGDVSMWHLQRNAWDVVALMCPCMFGSLVFVCLALSCSSMSSFPLLSVSHLCFSLSTILSRSSCFFLHSFWPPPSHPRLSEYLCMTLVFHCVSVPLYVLLPEHFLCLHWYWSVFHAAPGTLLASLGSMEKNSSIPLILFILCFQKPVIRMILTVRITSLPHWQWNASTMFNCAIMIAMYNLYWFFFILT